jgi:hypothetical protein
MIGAFKSIAEATEVNAQIVANGIYEALITTVFGLIIAIIAMIAHSLFTHRVDKFATEVERVCSELITGLAARGEAEGKSSAPPGRMSGNYAHPPEAEKRHRRIQRRQRYCLSPHYLFYRNRGI